MQRYVAVADFKKLVQQVVLDSYARSAELDEDDVASQFRRQQRVVSARHQFFSDFERTYPEEYALIQAETRQRRRDLTRRRIQQHVDGEVDDINPGRFDDNDHFDNAFEHAKNIRQRETQMRAYVAAGFHHPHAPLQSLTEIADQRERDRAAAPDFGFGPPLRGSTDNLSWFKHVNRDTGIQRDSYYNGMETYVNLDAYNIELRDSHTSPNAWYTYLTNTATIPEPILDSVDAASFECIPVYSPAFTQKNVYRPTEGVVRDPTRRHLVPAPPHRSNRIGAYINYEESDDEAESETWRNMTEEEQAAWWAYRDANKPPRPMVHPAERAGYILPILVV